MGFEVLKVIVSEIWTTRNRMHKMNALWSGEKVSFPSSNVLHVEIC